MKILITGGAGFIGSSLINLLIQKGHKVINIDSLTYAGNLKNLNFVEKHKNYFFIKSNICNKTKILEIFKKYNPNAIMHLAAETHVDNSIGKPNTFIRTNINGTYNLLEAVRNFLSKKNKNFKFKFIHISTDEVYGSLASIGKFNEKTPYSPNSPYSASKAASDHLVRAWYKTYKLPTIITNCSNNYGPRQFPEKLIPVIISRAIKNKQIPIYGKGKNIRDWIHVQDHVDALYKILVKGKIGKTYNIGSENEISNIDLAKKICTLLDEIKPKKNSYKKQLAFVKDRLGHDYRYAINSNLIKKELAWKPKIKFNDGLKKTIKWYLKNHSYLKYK
tara:strand:- start:29 stop:1027 length:999 start_codon:yes stop_codon:yes gene_type:complete